MHPNPSIPITGQNELWGHPKGLYLLFTTELWERFSYYGMRAILVLYLVDQVQGMGWSEVRALDLYGTFTMLVYLTPLVGGWLADNILGQRCAILLGGLLMAAGHFTMGVPHAMLAGMEEGFFYLGLGLLIAGNGLFKPNISTLVGELYPQGDSRRDGAFTIFYMGINIGAFLAPLVVGSVAQQTGWQNGFLVAGAGMLLSLVLQMTLANRYLSNLGVKAAAEQRLFEYQNRSRQPLTPVERDRIKVILILGLFTIVFWAGFEQAGGLMSLYTEQYADRNLAGWTVPTAWFQSLNPIFIVLCAPLVAGLWVKMGNKEPNSPAKFALGLALLGVGFLFMVGAALQQGGDEAIKISAWWLVAAYFFHTLGELCLSPIGLSMVTKLSPLRLASLMMGVWFFFVSLANKVAGIVGALIGADHGAESALAIFAGIAITAGLSALILLLMADKLVDWMHGTESQAATNIDENMQEEKLALVNEH